MFYGPGAGKLPTASAVVADIIDIIANREAETKVISFAAAEKNDLGSFDEFACERVIIAKEALTLPCDVKKSAEVDGAFVYVVAPITESDTDKIKAAQGDKLISVFRVI